MDYPRRTILRLMLYSGASLSLAGCTRRTAAIPDNVAYYTCTMHPSVRSQDPHGKCPICGMDLVPVMKKTAPVLRQSIAAGAPAEANEFTVPVERQQQIGVTYATVQRGPLRSTIRAVGVVTFDMTRHWAVVAHTDGYVEQLFVASPGQAIEIGDKLMSIYSPDLLTSEGELVQLLRARDESKSSDTRAAQQTLIDAAKARLRQWNVAPEQIAALEQSRHLDNHIVLCSPYRGVVQEVPVHQGVSVKSGDHLVDIADLSQVWVWASFYEDELGALQQGQTGTVTARAFPGREFIGKIAAISPSVDETTRTVNVRIDIANPDSALLPGMYANVSLEQDKGIGLTVPVDAILPTGTRNIAFVDRGQGKLTPRDVRIGSKYGDFYEVLDGLKENERVVSSANFLIDAESKVQGALQDFDTSQGERQ